MPDFLEIKLETLTPIWTGGLDGKSDQLHITGILGSLRWWYEVLVRSVGGHACDPTTHTCIYDHDKLHNGLCDVCLIFGTTGWARRFKLVVIENTLVIGSLIQFMADDASIGAKPQIVWA